MNKEVRLNRRTIGINFLAANAEVRVWAPNASRVWLVVVKAQEELKLLLSAEDFGYFFLVTTSIAPNDVYLFELEINGEILRRADPASLSQPFGVHGNSVALNLAEFNFTDQHWVGPPLNEYLIYELHVGTFTQTGNFDAIIGRLAHLMELGITAIELMPIAAFPGERNWGYDGVFPFAVQHSYGGASALLKLVNACHAKGIAVILDVVYNHFGPEGNYLEDFGPYLTDQYHTPWGKAVNFDGPYADGVRDFFIENALMWFRDFHIDALRLDAVHAIKDFSANHFLKTLSEEVKELNALTGRNHQLIIECDLNDPRYISPTAQGGLGMDSQWMDEFHHALRVAAGEKPLGYYADFNGLNDLAKSYQDAYVYDGQYSVHRKRHFGAKTSGISGSKFIVFSQNHDQVGNRMLGERSAMLYGLEMQKLMVGAVMVSPFIPMLFMGEEWGADSPFLYFVSHSDADLIAAVRKGRAAEFKDFHQGETPDPQAESTFEQSKLQWQQITQTTHAAMFAFYKAIIQLRKSNTILSSLYRSNLIAKADLNSNCLIVERWDNNERLLCLMNFSSELQQVTLDKASNLQLLIDSSDTLFAGPGSLHQSGQFKNISIHPHSILIFSSNHV